MRMSRVVSTLALLAVCWVAGALPARAAVVQGFVKDELGSGIQGVSVKFTGDTVGSQSSILTDPAGFYSAVLPLDSYRASFIPPENAWPALRERARKSSPSGNCCSNFCILSRFFMRR